MELRPRDSFVPLEQPLGNPMPNEGIEVSERRLGHAVPENTTTEHRIEAPEQISKGVIVPSWSTPEPSP
jgi:hypothetical protein